MTKSIYVDPKKVRKPGVIKFEDIPVNTYQKTVKDEKDNFTKEEFLRIYRDMSVIREFETMLNLIKTTGAYEGVEYNYPGPAHLEIGQEASYVGAAFELDKDDFIFGSHRGHGEFLAKGLSAIEKMSDEELTEIMENWLDGKTYAPIKKTTEYTNVKDIAREFLIYGAIAEIFGRDTGFGRGLGGSMHAFFIPFGIYPNNAIVGGGAPIATGAALYKKVNKKKGISVCSIGDGSIGCGPVYESMNFAAMDQLRDLWEEGYNGGLPIIYHVNNNAYGMGGQTTGETMAYGEVARFAAGICPNQMHTERVDGYNPLAVIDAYRRKKPLAESGEGPVVLEIMTYRCAGHSPSDSSTYRTKEEIDAWEKEDSIKEFARQLIEAEVATEEELNEIIAKIKKEMKHAFDLAIDLEISPRMDLDSNPDLIADLMFSNENIMSLDTEREPVVLAKKEDSPRVKKIANKIRKAYDDEGNKVSKNKVFQIRDAEFEAIIDKFYTDPTLIAYGEDNRDWGGAYAVYQGLTEVIPYHRLFNSPISEAAIVGSAVGYAMAGGRALVELMYIDFLGRCGDEVFNQMSKWQAMSAGYLKMPVILRLPLGNKYGAQHSQDWSSLCASVPGLKVVFPVTPYDCKGLMNAALSGTDPVLFLESQQLYDLGEEYMGEVPEGYYEVEIGEPSVKKEGNDVTILSLGATLSRAMKAADILEKEYGLTAEVIDARSIVPFNYEKVIESVKKTGKIVLTSDASSRGSVLNDFAANITELAFDYLDAPPVVVGAKNWITPCHELDHHFFPQADWIVDAIHEKIMPLAGHVCKHNFTDLEQIRRNKLGL